MYKVSDEYIAQVATGTLENKELSGSIKLLTGEVLPLSNKDFSNSSVSIDNKCSNNSDINLGSAYIGKLSLGLIGDYDRYSINKADAGAVITLQYKLGAQIIPLGVFNVYECTRKGRKLSINAYDNMSKLNKKLNTDNVNGHVLDVIKWISNSCGVEFKNTDEEINAFSNAQTVCNITAENYETYQNVLQEICELMGVFAYADRDGKIIIKRFGNITNFKLIPKMRKNVDPADYDVYYTTLIETDINNLKMTSTSGDGKGLTYEIDNKLITGVQKEKCVRNIMLELSKIKYTPCNLGIVFNPAFDLGDIITVKADGIILKQDIDILITDYKFSYNGSSTLNSVGSNRFLISTSTSSNSTSYGSSYNTLKNNGTYIATYKSISEYSINNEDKTIASIDFTIGESDKVSISGQCFITVNTAGTLKIKYAQNDNIDSFVPEQYLTEGKHIINFSNWFDVSETNSTNTYSILLVSDDGLNGTIKVDNVRAYVLASSMSEGKFYSNNVFEEEVDLMKYRNNIVPLGYKEEKKNV